MMNIVHATNGLTVVKASKSWLRGIVSWGFSTMKTFPFSRTACLSIARIQKKVGQFPKNYLPRTSSSLLSEMVSTIIATSET